VAKERPLTVRRSAVVTDDPRRGAILNAAFCLLMQRGYERTSTLDIASRAKVSKRELYQLFESKADIVSACVAARAERMRRPLTLPVPENRKTFIGSLTSFGSTFLREICDPAVVAIYRLAAIETERSPEVARVLDSAGRKCNRTALIKLLRSAQSSGILGAADPAIIASEFFGLLLGDVLLRLILRVRDPPAAREIDRRARAATEAVLRLYPKTNI
jgi:AcrR family transcriptional regulator